MNRSLIVGITLALIAQLSTSYAETQSVSGTGVLYDPSGNSVGVPTPISGTYNTDIQHIAIDPWQFFGFAVDSQIDLLPTGSYSFPGVLPINVGSGQAGGIISTTWGPNIIPHGIVWDVISIPRRSAFRANRQRWGRYSGSEDDFRSISWFFLCI